MQSVFRSHAEISLVHMQKNQPQNKTHQQVKHSPNETKKSNHYSFLSRILTISILGERKFTLAFKWQLHLRKAPSIHDLFVSYFQMLK